MNPRLGFRISSVIACLWQPFRSRGAATPLFMQNHTVAKAGLECKSNGVASEIGLLAYKNPVNLRELFDGVQRSYLVSVWKMERRPQFMEEKTSYELERDKHVAKLEKKLLPIIEAAAEL